MQPKTLKKLVVTLLIPTIIYQPALCAATINIDPRSNTVTLDRAQNGVQILHIAAPNSRGLSHNKFKDFNVGQDGLIINNSGSTGVSVLGGAILKNSNLKAGEEASLILNEVTGVSKSNLNGFTEIFGKKANYVVANPNGISCSGCGFINTNRVTLTTGRPELENGFLRNLNVEGGEISVVGDGLNSENVNYFEIISRTAKLQGQINAKELSVVTGRNDYDYETKQVTAKPDNGEEKPSLSIDASSLGSIYAGRIKLVSTEAGVGVNVPNYMAASASDIVIDSKGNLTYKSMAAEGAISLKATNKIEGHGSVIANGAVDVIAKDIELKTGSQLMAGGNITLSADSILNYGDVVGYNNVNVASKNITSSGKINASKDLVIDGLGTITNNGQLVAGQNANINYDQILNSGTIFATNSVSLVSSTLNNNGDISSSGNTIIFADNVANSSIGQILAQNALTLIGSGTLTNDGGLLSNNDVNINYSQVTNTGSILGTNLLAITTPVLNNLGDISSYRDIAIRSDEVNNFVTGTILATNDLVINGLGTLTNNGEILSGNDATFDFSQIVNTNNILATNVLNINTPILNNSGDVSSYKDICVETDQVTNSGSFTASNNLNIHGTNLNNTGNLLSEKNVNLTLDQILNSGTLSSNEQFNINSLTLNNTGNILSDSVNIVSNIQNSSSIEGGSVTLKGNIVNTGKITGWNLLDIETGSLNNVNGEMFAGVLQKTGDQYTDILSYGTLNLKYNGALTLRGKYFSTGDMNITADSFDNRTDLKSLYGLNITTTGAFLNQYGTVMAGIDDGFLLTQGNLKINATNVTNKNLLYSTDNLDINASNYITNSDIIFSKGTMNLYAKNSITNNNDAYIYSFGDMELSTLSTGTIHNNLGIIKTEDAFDGVGGGDITITTGSLINDSISGGKTMFIPLVGNVEFEYLIEHDVAAPTHNLSSDEDYVKLFMRWAMDGDSHEELTNWEYFDEDGNPLSTAADIGYERTLFGQDILHSYLTTKDYSDIRSGGNLKIDVTNLRNKSSDITAAGNIDIIAGHIDNSRDSRYVDGLHRIYLTKESRNGENITFFNAERDYLNLIDGNYSEYTYYATDSGPTRGNYYYIMDSETVFELEHFHDYAYSDRASHIIAGGTLNLHGKPTNSCSGDSPRRGSYSDTFYTDVQGSLSDNYSVAKPALNVGNVLQAIGINTDPLIIKPVNPTVKDIAVDGMIFKYSKGATYVIESNPLFTNVNKLMSSTYFAEKVGYSKDQFNALFMGDAYWEKEYIARQIEDSFHRKFIYEDVTSDAMQREVLLNNAMEISGELKLQLGIGLTEAQRKALKAPIVWYVTEEKVVNGKTVKAMVPKVYSPVNTDFDIGPGSVLAGRDINIEGGSGDVNIAGGVYADGYINIGSKNLAMANAEMRADRLKVKVDNNINIKASKIAITDSAFFDAMGDIVIDGKGKTTKNLVTLSDGSSLYTQKDTYVGSKINIGNNLVINANNMSVIGSDINVGNSASINTKGSLNLVSAEEKTLSDKRKLEMGFWSNTYTQNTASTTTQKASNISVGNQLNVIAGKDVNLFASNISGDKVYVEAKGDVNLVSGLNEATKESISRKSGFLSKKIDEVTDYKGINVGSSIVGKSINSINAGNDINLLGSNISSSADKGVTALSANNINVVAAKDIEGHSEYHKTINYLSIGSILGSIGSLITSGEVSFGGFKEGTKVSNKEIASASSINGANVAIRTKEDMTVVGSDISGKKISMDIGHDLNLLSTEQAANSCSQEKEGKIYVGLKVSGMSSLSLRGGVKYTEQKDTTESITNRVSTIKAGELSIKTGNDMVTYGSDIGATGNYNLIVGRDLKEYAVNDTSKSKSERSEVNTGVEFKLSANILGAIEGIGNMTKSVVTGDMFKKLGSINGVFSTFNGTMDNIAKINKSETRDKSGIIGQQGKMDSVSVGLNYFMDISRSESNTSTSTSIGSNMNAGGKLTAKIGRDAILNGSNISADEINMSVGRNLDIISAFDTAKSDSKDMSLGLTIGLYGTNVGVPSVSASFASSSSDKKWVNKQAGITSNGKLNIKVAGNTNLEGGLIASETGNLNLTTNTLTYNDLTGHETASTYGIGRSIDTDLSKQSTNIKYGSMDREQKARATVGVGTINIGDGHPVVGLNRDLAKALEVTKDDKVDLIDISVDDRLLTSDGRQDIVNQANRAYSNTRDLIDTTANYITNDKITSYSDAKDYHAGKLNERDALIKMITSESKEDRDAAQIIANQTDYDENTVADAGTRLAKNTLKEYGYKDEQLLGLKVFTYDKTGETIEDTSDSSNLRLGFRDDRTTPEASLIGYNMGNITAEAERTGNDLTLQGTMIHENMHAAGLNENLAGLVGDSSYNIISNALSLSGGGSIGEGNRYAPTAGAEQHFSESNAIVDSVPEWNKQNDDAPELTREIQYKGLVGTGHMTDGEFDDFRREVDKATGAVGASFILGYGITYSVPVAAPVVTSLFKVGVDVYNKVGVTAYKAQTAADNFSETHPYIAKTFTEFANATSGYASPLSTAPKNIGGTIGTGLFGIKEFGSPIAPLNTAGNWVKKVEINIEDKFKK